MARLFQWLRRIGYWASDSRVQLGNAVGGLGSLASPGKLLLLFLSASPLLLALWLLPVPPGSSWARLGERAAWQWAVLQDTPESYEWFYRNWATEAGQPVIAERIDDAAWARAVRANTYDEYAAYIAANSPGGAGDEDDFAFKRGLGSHRFYGRAKFGRPVKGFRRALAERSQSGW